LKYLGRLDRSARDSSDTVANIHRQPSARKIGQIYAAAQGGSRMATNKPYGDNRREGAVRQRSQVQMPNGHWVKRDAQAGRFMDIALEQVRGALEGGRSIGHAAIATVTLPGGLVRHYEHQRDHTPNAERRRDAERVLEDLRSLCRAAQAYEEQHEHATLTGLLEHAAGLHAPRGRRGHRPAHHRLDDPPAKGTEAHLVALLACEEQLLPSWRSLSSPDPERLAEERRLFYVAATRAKDRLLITHAAERGRRETGGPSRFLAEAGLCQSARSLAA
jgi:superfamily I DNA/RNA helicase